MSVGTALPPFATKQQDSYRSLEHASLRLPDASLRLQAVPNCAALSLALPISFVTRLAVKRLDPVPTVPERLATSNDML